MSNWRRSWWKKYPTSLLPPYWLVGCWQRVARRTNLCLKISLRVTGVEAIRMMALPLLRCTLMRWQTRCAMITPVISFSIVFANSRTLPQWGPVNTTPCWGRRTILPRGNGWYLNLRAWRSKLWGTDSQGHWAEISRRTHTKSRPMRNLMSLPYIRTGTQNWPSNLCLDVHCRWPCWWAICRYVAAISITPITAPLESIVVVTAVAAKTAIATSTRRICPLKMRATLPDTLTQIWNLHKQNVTWKHKQHSLKPNYMSQDPKHSFLEEEKMTLSFKHWQ